MKKGLIRVLLVVVMIMSFSSVFAQQSWSSWVAGVRKEAVSQGIRPQLFDKVFRGMRPGKAQVRLQRTQPEKRLTYRKYRNTRIDAYRITLGRKKYSKYRKLFREVGREYSVDPYFVAAIWGLETSYGHYMGSFPVVKSLATLAYSGRRKAFFRSELIMALHILDQGHITVEKYKGEWAGASGHGQFLPSSWFKYAVDYSGDGKKDVWTNKADGLASIANYLKGNGWQMGQPTRVQVRIPSSVSRSMINGYKVKKPISAWVRMGVRPAAGKHFPRQDLQAYLVKPFGGPEFMVFQNFRTLMKYNNSTFYALSLSYLADKISRRSS